MSDDRYHRQQLIPGWDQDRLASATVLVVGAGALGNEVLKNLVLLGMGHLVIVDLDDVESSNLSRTLLFRETDIGRPKAVAAAEALQEMHAAVRVTALTGDLRFVLGLARLHACTLVLGCLDNQGARSFLSRMCLLAQVPLLDGAMWAQGGEVRAFLDAEGPCFDCTLTPDERSDLWLRFSCSSGFRVDTNPSAMATAITTTAIIGGLLAQEAVRSVVGQSIENGNALVYSGQSCRMHRATLHRDPICPNHAPLDWSQVVPLLATADTLSAATVLAHAHDELGEAPTLNLGRDLLLHFTCPACGRGEPVGRVQGLISATAAMCPHCGAERHAQVTSTVSEDDAWASWTLAQLGVQPGDVFSVHAGDQVRLFAVPFEEV